MSATADTTGTGYAARVRAALVDLPAAERDDLLAVPASVVLARRAGADRRLRWVNAGVTVAALLAGLLTFVTWGRIVESGVSYTEVYDPGSPPALDGVTNIHPYSTDGKPLTDVLLYDQDGRPLVLGNRTTADGLPLTVVPRYDRQGRLLDHVYPQEQTVEDYTVELPADTGPQRRRVPAPTVTPPPLQPR